MIKPQILLQQKFSIMNVEYLINPLSNRKINPALESKLLQAWNDIYAEAIKAGKHIYNGKNYRLDDFQVNSEGVLTLQLSILEYSKQRPLQVLVDEVVEYGYDYLSKQIGIGGLILTSDGYFVLGKLSGKTMSVNQIDLIGGMLEVSDLEDGSTLWHKNLEEIQQETGIKPNQITEGWFQGVILTAYGNIQLLTFAKTSLNKAEVQLQFEAEHDAELKSLIYVPEQDIDEYLIELGGYKPLVSQMRQV
ncbi:MAG: hypothetical protein OHK0017_08280 [Patescibacteria group bacterium]